MKFRSSIFYTITFIFILAAVSISLAFLWLINYDQQNYTRELNSKYSVVSRITLYKMSRLITQSDYEEQMRNFKMPQIEDKNLQDLIIKDGVVLEEISADIGSSAIIIYQKNHFLKITHADKTLLLQDAQFQPYRYDIFKLIYLIIFSIIFTTYIFIIKKIKPLRKLKRQIDKFASGDLNINNIANGNDEISSVATAFYNSVNQIKKLNDSRQLFLRNIMHELKTPITKGRITAEMIPEGKNQARLISVFERLENLINEFAAVERVTSGAIVNEMAVCSVDDLIKEAIDIAMISSSKVEILNPAKINVMVDFKLFSIAIKNMIDNGYKYSKDQKVAIAVDGAKMEFITTGEELEYDLSYYTEPFSKGKNALQSFGLGLYIVDNILKAHSLKLGYRHEIQNGKSKNIFIFENFTDIVTL